MTVNPSGWRPSTPANEQGEAQTVTGNRALMLVEALLCESGATDQTVHGFVFPWFGVDYSARVEPGRSYSAGAGGVGRGRPWTSSAPEREKLANCARFACP